MTYFLKFMCFLLCCCCGASVVSDSVRPPRRQPTRLPCSWDSPGKNTGVGCHCLLQCMKVKSESEVSQSCPTLSDSMDCSLSDSSVHGIFQARVLEWGAIALSSLKKLKIELPYDSSNPTLGHIPGKNHNSKRYVFLNIHCSTLYNSQDKEAT